MKHLIFALGLALVSSVTMAQAEGTPPPDTARPTIKRIQADLNLTDEQVKKMREIRDQGGTRAEMQAVLTPEQRAKSAAMRNQHSNERGDRKARMQEQLGLSDAQVTKMEQIRHRGGSREEMRAVLTPEQQAKFDTLRSQYPRPKPEKGSAVKPAKNAAAKPATAAAATPTQKAAVTPAQQAAANPAPTSGANATPAPAAPSTK